MGSWRARGLLALPWILALCVIAALVLGGSSEGRMSAQGGSSNGTWSVPPDQTILSGLPEGQCTVNNQGNAKVIVEVKDSAGSVVSSVEVNRHSSTTVAVPAGGSVVVKKGSGGSSSSGTYVYVPAPIPVPGGGVSIHGPSHPMPKRSASCSVPPRTEVDG